VHFDIGDGFGLRPLSVHWKNGGPKWLRRAMWMCGILGHKNMRPAFRLAIKQKDIVPKQSTVSRQRLIVGSKPLTTDR